MEMRGIVNKVWVRIRCSTRGQEDYETKDNYIKEEVRYQKVVELLFGTESYGLKRCVKNRSFWRQEKRAKKDD